MEQAESSPLPGQPERPRRPGEAQPRGPDGPPGPAGGPDASGGPDPAGPLDPFSLDDPFGGEDPEGLLDHPVIAGYDGSPSSRHALAYAAGMSRRLDRPLLIVYVLPPAVYCEPLTGQVIGAMRDKSETERWLLAELDEVCDAAGIEVSVVIRRGSPARELAAAADETGADALVIGAPGHRWHQVAGSVPGWLARHAHCPVIVVP